MKKVLLALLILPFLAGCNWFKKEEAVVQSDDQSETTPTPKSKMQKFEELVGEAEEDDNYLNRPVNGEMSEKMSEK